MMLQYLYRNLMQMLYVYQALPLPVPVRACCSGSGMTVDFKGVADWLPLNDAIAIAIPIPMSLVSRGKSREEFAVPFFGGAWYCFSVSVSVSSVVIFTIFSCYSYRDSDEFLFVIAVLMRDRGGVRLKVEG
jgi:hypothetical protein